MMGTANILDYLEVQEDGTAKVNLKRINRDQGKAILEFSYDPEGRPKIRLADKKAALETLAKLIIPKDALNEMGEEVTIQSLDAIVRAAKGNVTVNQQFNIVQSQERHQLPEKTIDAIQ
jgi:hypothetical protein